MAARKRSPALRVVCSALVAGALALGCSGGGAPERPLERAAVRASAATAGESWYLNVARPAGGTVTSAEGLVNCGVNGTACGDAQGWTQYPSGQATVMLTATPDTARGWSFVQWAGACSGTTSTCTITGGSNQWVGAVFRSATRSSSGPSQYGIAYAVLVNAQGGGTAYSDDGWLVCRSGYCTGYFSWSTVAVLRAVPDPGYQLATWAGDCGTDGPCQLGAGADKYVLALFDSLPDVAHQNYSAQALHGPAYLDFLGGRPGARQCSSASCHGATLNGAGIAPSCHTCHAQAGWTGWQTNCSFCHGARTTQAKAGYAAAEHPTWSAPPDAVAQRLDPTHAAVPSRTGAHQAHLTGMTAGGLSFAQPFACATCHPVATDLMHTAGSGQRATVALSGAGQASLPASLGTYDPATGTCTILCHGASPSPAWSATGLACGSCHGLPPTTADGHPAVGTSLAGCRGCHADTMLPDGSIDVASGKHIDGMIEASGGHGDYSLPAVHGPAFFDALRADGASSCRGCHGGTYGGGTGPSCNDCHAGAGWTASWQTNCSFCHGVRSTETMTTAYDVALRPTLSAPPDAVSERLTGVPAPAKTGAHGAHLTGQATNGVTYAAAVACSVCHAVPADLAHAGGVGPAPVALAGTGSLPASLGSYAPAMGTCATYCHGLYSGTYTWESYDWGSDSYVTNTFQFQGSGATPAWSDGPMACASCHGNPPRGGNAWWHAVSHGNIVAYRECQLCHPDATSINGVGQAINNPVLHVNGVVEVTPKWSTRCFGCH